MPLGSFLRRSLSGLVVVAVACPAMGRADDSIIDYHEFYGTFSMENRWFPESPAHAGQSDADTTFVAEPSLYLETADGTSFTLETFFRYDSADSERHLADVREAYLLLLGPLGDDEWELRLGFDHVFWGVAESRHLVDIINQTDLVANPNEEVKLGQPMAHVTVSGDWGVAELFALPWHRPRTYPGRDGRLRGEFVVDNDRLQYESAAGERHLDLAARYSHSFGPFDIGLSVFDGTSREPYLDPVLECGPVPDPARCRVTLVPLYEQIRQFGLDAQMTTGGWLLKLEAIGAPVRATCSAGRRTSRPSSPAANTPSTPCSSPISTLGCWPNGIATAGSGGRATCSRTTCSWAPGLRSTTSRAPTSSSAS